VVSDAAGTLTPKDEVKIMRTYHNDQGTTDIGVPMLIMAVIGAIALYTVWADVPTWGATVAIVLISIFALAGFFMAGKGGFTKL